MVDVSMDTFIPATAVEYQSDSWHGTRLEEKEKQGKGVLSGSRRSLLTEHLNNFNVCGRTAIGVHSG
jgi:hypothetical protein